MIRKIDGVQSVLSLVDHVVEHRPSLPPLVIAISSADGSEARTLLDGYRERLCDIDGVALVPHAHADAVTAAVAGASAHSPDVGLLDELAKQLKASIPRGAGKNWRARRFQLILDVLTAADEITTTTTEATREALHDQLYARWEKRNQLLTWTRTLSQADLPTKVLGIVLAVLFGGPSRWLFGRRLNRRGLRWFGEHVKKATGRGGDFLGQAVYLFPGSGLADVATLQRRVLFDALLHDVALFTQRRRFLPSRRRRRWTPVLLLDATDPVAASLVTLYSDLTAQAKVMPLLVVAAVSENAIGDEALWEIDEAVTRLRAVVEKREERRRIALRLPDEAGSSTNGHVTPQIPGRASALAPLVLTLSLVLAGTAFAAHEVVLGGCSDTKVVDGTEERVGIIESGCSFGQPGTAAPGVPSLTALEDQVFLNNEAVDAMETADGKQRYFREVIFFAPLTRPDTAERTAPPNAIWQLRGAVNAQREHNEKARVDGELVPLKLLLANSGDRFSQGAWVAEKIAARPRSRGGELAAVIGISQSRKETGDLIRDHLGGIPVIGASMYGGKMTDRNPNMFLTSPWNEAWADQMKTWLGGRPASIVFDPDDEYFSRDLRDLLANRGIGSQSDNVEVREQGNDVDFSGSLSAICEKNLVPVLTNRADQILKFLSRMDGIKACKNKTGMPVLAGPGLVVEAAKGSLAKRYSWAEITMLCLAANPVESEESTGRDAFQFAALAVREARRAAGELWEPVVVRTELEKSTVFADAGLHQLNDRGATGRIKFVRVN
ncbi:ABC transporter substrate-binding protein [Lentzea sp. NPDC060358]|uniref:ABC transporter substrate-binding protein n=1 Tax=Lentzea sp. NPDC060358 TaxID=3347103 RepID=UPI003667735E